MSKELTISNYTLLSKLGQGAFAKVYKGHSSENPDTHVAIKIESHDIHKKEASDSALKNEIDLHSRLEHPRIIKILDSGIDATMMKHSTQETRTRSYLVTEYCSNGDLFTMIKLMDGLSEHTCKHYFR